MLKNYYIFFIILPAILIRNLFYVKYRENFEENKKIVLLGDSIFKNNNYVNHDESVEFLLKKELTDSKKLYTVAQDNATIDNVYNQLNNVPRNIDGESTYIFISVGGNDLLENYIYSNDPENNPENINIMESIFNKYNDLIDKIINTFSKSNVVLSTIYYPLSHSYKPYYPIINNWNTKISELAREKNIKIIRIDKEMKKKSDFVDTVEPSSNGSIIIVNNIMAQI